MEMTPKDHMPVEPRYHAKKNGADPKSQTSRVDKNLLTT